MKYLKQIAIILLISFLGELLNYVIPLPIPGSIYGLVLMFLGLMTHLIPLDSVKDAGNLFLGLMPMMFIPAGVGLMTSVGILKPLLLPYGIVILATTILVMVISGHVTQLVIRLEKKHKHKEATHE